MFQAIDLILLIFIRCFCFQSVQVYIVTKLVMMIKSLTAGHFFKEYIEVKNSYSVVNLVRWIFSSADGKHSDEIKKS